MAWLGTSAFALASRGLYDRARRSVERIGAVPRPQHEVRATATAMSLSRRAIERAASDAASPPGLAASMAVIADRRWGGRLLREAADHGGGLSKWRRIAALRILARAERLIALPLLAQAVADDDADVARAAVTMLGGIPDRWAAEILVDALRRGVHVRSRIATYLDAAPFDLADELRPLLRDPIADVRYWAAILLGGYSELPGLAAELVRLAGDRNDDVRAAAAEALGAFPVDQAVPTLRKLVRDPAWFVRVHAARSLGRLRAREAATDVAALLPDASWWVRFAAKQALEWIGEVEPVVAYLRHADEFARNGAAEVLQNLGIVDDLVEQVAAGADDRQTVELLDAITVAGGERLLYAAIARRLGAPRVRFGGV